MQDFTYWMLEPEEYTQELQAIEAIEADIADEIINELLEGK
jgi:hypothetical protein